jgi:hypothetical protein
VGRHSPQIPPSRAQRCPGRQPRSGGLPRQDKSPEPLEPAGMTQAVRFAHRDSGSSA